MTFCDQLKVRLTGLEEHFDLPYADILEMPILFQKIPVPDTFSGTRNIISAFILSHITV